MKSRIEYSLFILLHFLSVTVFCQEITIELNDGYYYINDEKIFLKGIGYEAGAIPGQLPWEREFDEDLLRYDMKRIEKSGFNAIRTWSSLTAEELSVISDFDIYIIMGIWIDPHGDFNDTSFIHEAINNVEGVLSYSKNYSNIIGYLIMNEPLQDVIFTAGYQNTVDLWLQLIDIIHDQHPGVPVSIANSPNGTYIDPEIFDFSAYNVYIYNPVLVNHTHLYTGYIDYLSKLRNDSMPLLVTEFGLSVSPSGPGSYGYGGNTQTEQMEGNLEMYRSLIDGGASGAFVFNYSDGWWKGGNEFVHDDNPEEWFGLIEYENIDDKYGTPRMSWEAVSAYNSAIITFPRNGHIYTNEVPLEIFASDTIAYFSVSLEGEEIYSSQIFNSHFADTLITNEIIKDYELSFQFYNGFGQLLKTEDVTILIASKPVVTPGIELSTSVEIWSEPIFANVSLLFTSNGIAFNIDDSFHYATYKHLGFEYGDAYTAPLPSSFDTFTHTFTEYINEQSPVVTFAAGLGYSYGNFQNWIYDQELLVFDGYLNVADPGNNLSESDIIIFPNPAQEYFVIEGYQIPEDLSEIRIYNIDGSIILKDRLVLMQPYDISRLASGLYWIQLVFNSDHSRWKKLIKK